MWIYLAVACIDSILLICLYTAVLFRVIKGSKFKLVIKIVSFLLVSNIGTLVNSWAVF